MQNTFCSNQTQSDDAIIKYYFFCKKTVEYAFKTQNRSIIGITVKFIIYLNINGTNVCRVY